MRKELKFHHKKNKKQKNRLNTKDIIQETRGNKAKCILKANSKMTEVPNIFNLNSKIRQRLEEWIQINMV